MTREEIKSEMIKLKKQIATNAHDDHRYREILEKITELNKALKAKGDSDA